MFGIIHFIIHFILFGIIHFIKHTHTSTPILKQYSKENSREYVYYF